MINYKEIVESSKGDEAKMWESVFHISDFVAKIAEVHPEITREFLTEQYELMNGKHLNEWLAKKLVADMWHTDISGNKVVGEAITVEEAMQLVSDKPTEKQSKCKWDAYVAANAFAHDLGTTGISKSDVLKAAKAFWFKDEDMAGKHKVYWYFKDKIFG